MKIYVTTMYRWGDRENHSYVVYAGFDKDAAIKCGIDTHWYRGKKYDAEIIEFTADDPKSKKIIQILEDFNENL